MDTIVVGVDGSENGRGALRWAIVNARAIGARIRAIYVWDVPLAAYGGGMEVVAALENGELERAAVAKLEAAVAGAVDGDEVAVEIERRTVEGNATRALLMEAAREDVVLLVVGSRGRGGFAGLRLGSVSAALAHHAPCPLVIVPPVDRDA